VYAGTDVVRGGKEAHVAPLELSLFWGRGAIIRSFLRNYGCEMFQKRCCLQISAVSAGASKAVVGYHGGEFRGGVFFEPCRKR
jgi:hypothetical protein